MYISKNAQKGCVYSSNVHDMILITLTFFFVSTINFSLIFFCLEFCIEIFITVIFAFRTNLKRNDPVVLKKQFEDRDK